MNLRDQRGDGDWIMLAMLAVIGLAGYGGYQLFLNSKLESATTRPRFIDADGQSYFACRGTISISKEGGGGLFGGGTDTFEVKFTDATGLGYELHGVHKVALMDIPKLVDAPFPANPSLIDDAGKPLVNGRIYKWSDGSTAQFTNGELKPIQKPNDVCSPK